MTTALRSVLRISLLALAIGAFAPAAPAQPERSPNDLRVENDRLKERIEELEGQLDAARKRIDSLEDTINRLREQLRDRNNRPAETTPVEGESGEQAPERETAPVPDEPFASLPSMVMSLRENYQMQFAGKQPGDGRDREEYIREVRAWAREAVRNARGQVTWTIRVVDVADQQGSRASFLVETIDSASGLPIGLPFTLDLVGRNAVRLRDGADQLWILEGVLQSEIVVDDQMPTPESASDPGAYLGPFARYTYELVVRSLREAD